MKIKLLQDTTLNDQLVPAGHILDIEDTAGQTLIDNGSACLYTPEMEQADETQIIQEEVESIKAVEKTLKVQAKSIHSYAIGNKKMETNGLFGKAIKDAIETKAVTDYTGTVATEPLGIAGFNIGLASKCKQMPVKGTLNVVYSLTKATSAELPLVDITDEATANATTVALTNYEALPAKLFATVGIPNEYIDDISQMESFVSAELRNDAEAKTDKYILRGAFSGNKGLKGVVASTDSLSVAATLSAIAITDLHEMVDTIIPELQPNCIWVINPLTWSQLKGSFLDVDNVNNQLITDGANKTLLGYPVKISSYASTTNPIIFGDFSKYVFGIAKGLSIEVDRSASFVTDQTQVKISYRVAGGPACSKKTIDGASYAAFVFIKA